MNFDIALPGGLPLPPGLCIIFPEGGNRRLDWVAEGKRVKVSGVDRRAVFRRILTLVQGRH